MAAVLFLLPGSPSSERPEMVRPLELRAKREAVEQPAAKDTFKPLLYPPGIPERDRYELNKSAGRRRRFQHPEIPGGSRRVLPGANAGGGLAGVG